MTPPIRTVALLQLAVLLGVAAGIGFAQWQGPDPPGSGSQATGAPLTQEPRPRASLPEVTPSPSSEDATGPRTIIEWIEGETVAIPAGDGQISGLVLLDGAPLAGIQLTAVASTERDVPEDEAFIDRLMGTLRHNLLQKSLERHRQTDETGRFLFEGLDEGYQYLLLAEGYSLDPIDGSDGRKFPVGSEIELAATARSQEPSSETKAKPPWATGGVDATVLVGYVEGLRGFGTLVIAEGQGPLTDPLEYTRIRKLGRGKTTFRKFLHPGKYTLAMEIIKGIPGESERWRELHGFWPIEVEKGFNEVHLALEPPPTMEVVVSSASGEPIEDASFSWVQPLPHGSSSQSSDTFKVAGHRYFLVPSLQVLDALSGRSGQEVSLKVYSPGYSVAHVPVDRLAPIEVHLEGQAWCNIEISDYLGSGFEGRLVFVLRKIEDSSPFNRDWSVVDWLGRARIGPKPQGTYQLETRIVKREGLLRNPFGSDISLVGTETVHLSSGDNLIQVGVPRLYSLVIDLDAELFGNRVSIRSVDGQWGRYFPAVRDTLIVRGVPAGEYVVTAGINSTHVRVPQENSVFLRPKVFNTLLISGISPTSPEANRLLKVGDQLIAINGVPFSSLAELEAAKQRSHPSAIVVTIIRDGMVLDLELSSEVFSRFQQEYIER